MKWLRALFILDGTLLLLFVLFFSQVLSQLAGVGWGEWTAKAYALFIVLVAFAALRFFAAFFLFVRKPWARFFTLVIGVLSLPGFPVGTAVGVLSIWLLAIDERAKGYFGG